MRIYKPKLQLPKQYLDVYALVIQDFYSTDITSDDDFFIEPMYHGPEQSWDPQQEARIETRYNKLKRK